MQIENIFAKNYGYSKNIVESIRGGEYNIVNDLIDS